MYFPERHPKRNNLYLFLTDFTPFVSVAQKRIVSFLHYYLSDASISLSMSIIINFTEKINIFFQKLY